MRVAVVGAGVLGASAAWELALAGADVTLFEMGTVGEGSSSRAAGVSSEVTWDEQDRLWVAESRELYRKPPDRGPALFRETGSLTYAEDPGDLRVAERSLEKAGTSHELVDGRGLAKRFPALRLGGHGGALFVPGDGVVSGADYARAAVRALRGMPGAVVRTDVHVRLAGSGPVSPVPRMTAARGEDGEVRVVLPDGEAGVFDRILVAAGAWTRLLFQPLGLCVPIRPYRTQLVSVEHAQRDGLPTEVFHDLALGWYWVPESATGRFLIGDGTEHTESDPDRYAEQADDAFLQSVAMRLTARTRGGEEARLGRAWAGLCTATEDRRPLLGPVRARPQLWIATGMNGFGVMRGPAVGRAVARALWADDPDLLPARYRADRPGLDGRMPPSFQIREGYTLEPPSSSPVDRPTGNLS